MRAQMCIGGAGWHAPCGTRQTDLAPARLSKRLRLRAVREGGCPVAHQMKKTKALEGYGKQPVHQSPFLHTISNHYVDAVALGAAQVVETELIGKQMRSLVEMENSGLVALLAADDYEDLARMYSLFKRIDDGLDLIRSVMSAHLKRTGSELVQVRARERQIPRVLIAQLGEALVWVLEGRLTRRAATGMRAVQHRA
jgi:Cullin family